ncbi:MAG: hypothetical protein LBE97_01745, partial [Holosporales bacterium]|nr:hypothetical protein [Holosporales bacterium]
MNQDISKGYIKLFFIATTMVLIDIACNTVQASESETGEDVINDIAGMDSNVVQTPDFQNNNGMPPPQNLPDASQINLGIDDNSGATTLPTLADIQNPSAEQIDSNVSQLPNKIINPQSDNSNAQSSSDASQINLGSADNSGATALPISELSTTASQSQAEVAEKKQVHFIDESGVVYSAEGIDIPQAMVGKWLFCAKDLEAVKNSLTVETEKQKSSPTSKTFNSPQNGQMIMPQQQPSGFNPQYNQNGQMMPQQQSSGFNSQYQQNGQMMPQQQSSGFNPQYQQNGQMMPQQQPSGFNPQYQQNWQMMPQQQSSGFNPQYQQNGQMMP